MVAKDEWGSTVDKKGWKLEGCKWMNDWLDRSKMYNRRASNRHFFLLEFVFADWILGRVQWAVRFCSMGTIHCFDWNRGWHLLRQVEENNVRCKDTWGLWIFHRRRIEFCYIWGNRSMPKIIRIIFESWKQIFFPSISLYFILEKRERNRCNCKRYRIESYPCLSIFKKL